METKESMMELLNRKEDLCDELMEYFIDGKIPMLRHPLVYSIPHHSSSNALLNKQFQHRKEHSIELLNRKDYEGYVFLHEKPYRLHKFIEIKDKLSNRRYWRTLGEVWINSENIWQNISTWKELLKSTLSNKQCFMESNDRKVYESLPGVITVYRGYIPGKNMAGLSYTLSEEKALWFAKRFSSVPGKVIRISIPKSKIFAYLDGRNEQEIIIL